MELAEKAVELATELKDRRAAPRFDVDEEAHLVVVNQGSAIPCRVIDLSLNGCRMRTKERFPAGARVRVEVNFKVRGLAFRFCGTTQWTDGRNLVGIRFVDVPARRKDDLVEALSEVEAESAAKAAKETAEKLAAENQAAEQEAAAKLAVEEETAAVKAAALKAAAARFARQAEEIASRQTPVQLPKVELPKIPIPDVLIPKPATAFTGLSGPLVGPHPAARTLSASPQLPELQKVGAPPASPPMPKPTNRERRVEKREEVDTSVVIHLINIAARLQGRILDLSLHGCRIRADERFPVGIYTRAEIEFHLDGLPFRLGGVVQAIHDKERRNIGFRFLDMSERRKEQVEQLIDDIREQREQGQGIKE